MVSSKAARIGLSLFFILSLVNLTAEAESSTVQLGDSSRLSIKIDWKSDDSAMLVIDGAPVKSTSVFTLENPFRLVIDLDAAKQSIQKIAPMPQGRIIRRIRVGSHPDKLRVVLDLNVKTLPQHSWSQNGNIISVKLGRAAGLPIDEIVPPEEETRVPAPSNNSNSSPAATKPALMPSKAMSTPSPAPVPTAPPAETNIPAPLPTPTPAGNLPAGTQVPEGEILNGIGFETLVPENVKAVRLQLSTARPKYRVLKKADRLWMVSIPDTRLSGSHLQLVQFPPSDFEGFTHVIASQSGKDADVAIGVERNVKIRVFSRDNSIYIKIAER